MRSLPKILCLVLLLSSSSSFASEPSAFNAVQRLFAAMSAFDYARMKDTGTADFQLLEHGEVWDMDTLIENIKPGGAPYQRRNYFKVIRSVPQGDSVWVSYWNRADFTSADGQKNSSTWLESVVLVDTEDGWKVQMMHSTRLDPSKPLPTKDLVLEEYTE